MTDLTRLDAYGLNVIYQLAYRKLHSTETAAARVVTLSPKFCDITLVLMNLDWLPLLIFGLNLKYLLLLTRLSMDLLLLIFKNFFKVTTQYGILGLQRNIC